MVDSKQPNERRVKNMKNITAMTEKRIQQMKKNDHRYAKVLEYILTEIKCFNSCDDATVAQLKKLGLELPNQTQINVYEMPEMNGLSILYLDYISAVFCLDLHYLNIYDFNGLVKILSELPNKGYY